MTRLTLPWMDRIRAMEDEGVKPKTILTRLFAYGLREELRIEKAYQEMDERLEELDKDMEGLE